jgi:DNA-binding transcriptional MerR regulator
MIKLFGKKKEEEAPLGKGFVPIDRVRELSDKGFSEPEIIDVLRKEGFGADEIDRALTQVLKLGVTGQPAEPSPLPTMEELPTQAYFEGPTMPQMPERSIQYQQYPEGYGTEELVESVVQERMGEVDQRFVELVAKQADLERSISNLHHQLSIMSKGRTQTEEAILAKIDSFKDSLDDINGRMSSLEKAFKDALPALIESVRSLTDLVQRVKKET